MKLKVYQCPECRTIVRAKPRPPKTCAVCLANDKKACKLPDEGGVDWDELTGKDKQNRAEKYSRAEAKAGVATAPTAKAAKEQAGVSVYQVFRDQNGIAYLRVEIRKTGLARYVVNKGFGVEVVELDRATIAGMNLLPVPGASILNAARRLAQPLNSSVIVSQRAHEQLNKILTNTEMIEMEKAKKFATVTAPAAKKSNGNSAAKTATKKAAKAPKAAKKSAAKKSGAKNGERASALDSLVVKLVKMPKEADGVSAQPMAICETLKENGSKMEVPKLIEKLGKKIESSQPMKNIWSLKRKALVDGGFISVSRVDEK